MDSERDTSSVGNPGRGRPLWQAKLGLAGWTLAGIGILSQAGCMSALTSTTLREALRETAASLSSPHDLDHASTARVDRPVADVEAVVAENSPGDDAQLEQMDLPALCALAEEARTHSDLDGEEEFARYAPSLARGPAPAADHHHPGQRLHHQAWHAGCNC